MQYTLLTAEDEVVRLPDQRSDMVRELMGSIYGVEEVTVQFTIAVRNEESVRLFEGVKTIEIQLIDDSDLMS